MKDKKLYILIALAGLAVASILYGANAPKAIRLRHPDAGALAGKQGLDPSRSVILKRYVRRTGYTSWKRDPFSKSGKRQGELVLNGIIWSAVRPKAMIGDLIVAKGDKVGSATVVDVQKDKVILSDGGKQIELSMSKT